MEGISLASRRKPGGLFRGLVQRAADEHFDPLPKNRVAFYGDVRLDEHALVPRIGMTFRRRFLVAVTEIAENGRVLRIGRANFVSPVQHAVGLKKVYRPLHVSWNDCVVL